MQSKNLTIEQIETIPFRLPMHGALRWGTHSAMSEVCHLLVTVTLSDGSVGFAEAPPRPTIYGETVQSIVGIIADEFAPRLVGMAVDGDNDEGISTEPAQPLHAIQARLHEIKNNNAAKGALDIAIHDAIAHSLDIPLADYLGIQAERVKVSYILGIGERETMLTEAQRVVAQGVRVLKVKVGRDWDEDIARIMELLSLLGPDVALYADANECLTVEDAPKKLSQLAEMGLLYCEEPLPVACIQERAALCQAQHLPLIADDSAFTLRDLQRELALDTFDILNIKTARTGYSESMQMLRLARQFGKGVMVGSQASAGLGTARAALFAAMAGVDHPSELSFFLKLKEDILTKPIPIVDGYIYMKDIQSVQINTDQINTDQINTDQINTDILTG